MSPERLGTRLIKNNSFSEGRDNIRIYERLVDSLRFVVPLLLLPSLLFERIIQLRISIAKLGISKRSHTPGRERCYLARVKCWTSLVDA